MTRPIVRTFESSSRPGRRFFILNREGSGGCGERGNTGVNVLADQAHGLDGGTTIQNLKFRDVVITVRYGERPDLRQIRNGQRKSLAFR